MFLIGVISSLVPYIIILGIIFSIVLQIESNTVVKSDCVLHQENITVFAHRANSSELEITFKFVFSEKEKIQEINKPSYQLLFSNNRKICSYIQLSYKLVSTAKYSGLSPPYAQLGNCT